MAQVVSIWRLNTSRIEYSTTNSYLLALQSLHLQPVHWLSSGADAPLLCHVASSYDGDSRPRGEVVIIGEVSLTLPPSIRVCLVRTAIKGSSMRVPAFLLRAFHFRATILAAFRLRLMASIDFLDRIRTTT